jgi:hypothetical protein
MNLHDWSKSNSEYARKLLDSGMEGARCGREAFLQGGALAPFLGKSLRNALKPAALGLCLGVLGSGSGNHRKSVNRAAACGLLGGVIGLGLGIAWESRCLAGSVASAVCGSIGRVRDEHWLEKHPIDYA